MQDVSNIYIHGFASSPQSTKVKYLQERFAELSINLKVPDLNQGGFPQLTISRQLTQVSAEFPPPPASVTLIGSSLGGLTAAWLAEKHPQVQRLVLLAPAFGFLSHWLPRLGEEQLKRWQTEQYLQVYHYGEQRFLPLSYDFLLDARQYQDEQLQRSVPTLILHGRDDDVIPIQSSRDYSADRPWVKLVELDSDHTLSNVLAQIWEAIQDFHQLRGD